MNAAIAYMLVLTGLAIIAWRVRTRRVGVVPHCRRCDYVLVGIQSAACPECGQELKPAGMVYGDRGRSQSLAVACVALVALDVILVVGHVSGVFNRVDWYTRVPTRWVLRDLAMDNPSAKRAWHELKKRVAAKRLSPEQLSELTDREIDWQARYPQGWSGVDPRNDLIDKAAVGALSKAQSERFFSAQKITLRCFARPVIGPGEPILSQVSMNSPTLIPLISSQVDVSIDNAEVGRFPSAICLVPGVSLVGIMANAPTDLIAPGKHRLRATARFVVGPPPRTSYWTPASSANIFVLEADQDIEILTSPSVRALAEDGLKGLWAEIQHYPTARGREVDCWLQLPARKCAVAGKVSMWVDGKEYPLSDALMRANETGFIAVGSAPSPMPDSVDVVFRSDPSVALRTFDVREVGGGEIRLKHVRVREFPGRVSGRAIGGGISPGVLNQ